MGSKLQLPLWHFFSVTAILCMSTSFVSTIGIPCMSVNNQPGKCVSFDMCPLFLRILKSPQITGAEIRLLQKLTCDFDQPKICCPYNEVVQPQPIIVDANRNPQFQSNLKHPPPQSQSQYYPQGQFVNNSSRIMSTTTTFLPPVSSTTPVAVEWPNFGSEEDLQKPVDRLAAPSTEASFKNHHNFNLLPDLNSCGNVGSTDNIVGGKDVAHGGHPWMIRIGYRNTETNEIEFYCSGTIISRRYVLTAAHCSEEIDPEYIPEVIRVGEHNTTSDRDCSSIGCSVAQDYPIEQITAHPDYNPDDKFNDIGIIRVAKDFDFTSRFVRPICLPFAKEYQVSHLFPANFNGRKGLVAGWGRTKWNRAEGSTVLQEVHLPMLSNDECQVKYSTRAKIIDKQMCAGGIRGKDSCGGDSGGPFILPINTGRTGIKFFQLGVVSFGPVQCGVGGLPGVYSKVSSYFDWILDNVKP